MTQAMVSAFSGLVAATRAVEVVAANLANAQSTGQVLPVPPPAAASPAGPAYQGYRPLRVVQAAQAGGGVTATLQEVDPAYVEIYDPGHPDADAAGIVRLPNVSPETELVNLIAARHAYEANLAVLRTADAMLGALFDRKV